MSGGKHTSGPWHVFSVYAHHEVRTPTDTLVAVVNSRDDARLIAVAPELLERLTALCQRLGPRWFLENNWAEPLEVLALSKAGTPTQDQEKDHG